MALDPLAIANMMSEDLSQYYVLLEDVESRLPALIRELRVSKLDKITGKETNPWALKSEEEAKNFILQSSQFDPTPNKGYTTYLVMQVRQGKLNLPEDGERFKITMSKFIKLSKKQIWKAAGGHSNVAQYKNWRELEDAVSKFSEEDAEMSEREKKADEKSGAEKIYELDIGTAERDEQGNPKKKKYEIYKITTPAAAVRYGRGTRWCTSTLSSCHQCQGKKVGPDGTTCAQCKGRGYDHYYSDDKIGELPYMEAGEYKGYPVTAASYLKDGPLYVVFKEGKQYGQANWDFSQWMNITDTPLFRCSAALDFFFQHVVQNSQLPPEAKAGIDRHIRSRCGNYPGRIPPVKQQE